MVKNLNENLCSDHRVCKGDRVNYLINKPKYENYELESDIIGVVEEIYGNQAKVYFPETKRAHEYVLTLPIAELGKSIECFQSICRGDSVIHSSGDVAEVKELFTNGRIRVKWSQNSKPFVYVSRSEITFKFMPTMGYAEAVTYCANQGRRLPTAREIAKYGVRKGYIKIYNHSEEKFESKKVESLNPDGSVDVFYSRQNDSAPKGIIQGDWFWTSSRFIRQNYYNHWDVRIISFNHAHGASELFVDDVDVKRNNYGAGDIAVMCVNK